MVHLNRPKTSLGRDCHKLDVTNTSAFDLDSLNSTSIPAWHFRDERVDARDVPDLLALAVLRKLDERAMADPGEVLRILRGIALPGARRTRILHHDSIFGRKKLDFERVFGRMGEEVRRRTEAGFGQGIGKRVRGGVVE